MLISRFICTVWILLLSGLAAIAQQPLNANAPDTADYPYWIRMMQDPDANFYATRSAFNKYWEHRKVTKGDGWKVFNRWEYIHESRVQPDGKLPAPDYVMKQFNNYLFSHPQRSMDGNWTQVGPVALPVNETTQPNGLGRINAIAFHPTDANTFYVGSPCGGIWKTSNGGSTWSDLSGSLPTLGVSAILIHPASPGKIWIGTGDRDAGDAPGMGVYKSTDGGATWNSSNSGMGNSTVGMMIIHPTNSNIILAATSSGIYKSTDGGATWTLKSITGVFFKDIKFKPGDPTIVYATENGHFYRSTNTGDSWTLVTSGIITGSRMVIGVSPNNANYVYLVQTNGPFAGLLRSTNSGVDFTTRCTSPNIMDYGCDGSGTSSQAWYDLCIAVDPDDVNVLYVGGTNIWKSTNSGSSFTINSHWTGSCNVPAVHADIHTLEWGPLDGKLYNGNDGGIYFTANAGINWTDISSGLAITQVYKIGQSQTSESLVINGYQDNGTSIQNDTSFTTVIGGDGMECIIDYSNSNYRYGEVYYGTVFRSSGSSYSVIAGSGINGINESGNWVTPYILHETNSNTMFIGYKNVWRSTNVRAVPPSWSIISSGENYACTVLEQSPANVNILYVVRPGQLKRSDNANAANPGWTTCALPGGNTPTDLEAHPTNPDILYATTIYSVYKSTDKGQTWTSITGTLPAIPINCIVYDEASNEGLYLGNETGIFYRDASMSDWVIFNTGLPVVDVRELEIYKGNSYGTRRIKAATYGRGLWSSDLMDAGVADPSDFVATGIGISEVGLSWTKNPGDNNVLLAFNMTDSFGSPAAGYTYDADSTLSGGGIVIYNGSSISFNHLQLDTNTTYYYKLWSYDSSNQYSSGATGNATTFDTLISTFPWTTDFENGGTIPSYWSQYNESGSLDWSFQPGGMNNGSHPASAHSGTYNACLYVANHSHPVTKLVSPPMDLTGIDTPVLRFWHTQEYWAPDQDELKIYYRTSPSGTWELLASYLNNIPAWTQESMLLPNSSATYYVAFEGRANYGFGACVDDIVINQNTMTWSGTGDWSNPANWLPGFVPSEFDNVVINSGTCIFSASVTCKSLTVNPGAAIDVDPAVTVTLTGTNP
jgi:photosystem II stability/assembly factor-like uncharacterized protein